jgi:hypothetical protein
MRGVSLLALRGGSFRNNAENTQRDDEIRAQIRWTQSDSARGISWHFATKIIRRQANFVPRPQKITPVRREFRGTLPRNSGAQGGAARWSLSDIGVNLTHARTALLDPETGEPAMRGNGETIYDPSEIDLFAAALYYGLQDPKYAPYFMQFWFEFSYLETACERSHAVTLERIAQGAYRRPGSTGFEPFNKGNPGRPLGPKDKRPRQPRGWKEFMALAYAGRVGFDLDTRKIVRIDPDTHEPVLDEHGKVINPSYLDVAAEALYLGLQDRQTLAGRRR